MSFSACRCRRRRSAREWLSRTADIVSATLDEMGGATAPRLQLELMIARVLTALRASAAAAQSALGGERRAPSRPHTARRRRACAAVASRRSGCRLRGPGRCGPREPRLPLRPRHRRTPPQYPAAPDGAACCARGTGEPDRRCRRPGHCRSPGCSNESRQRATGRTQEPPASARRPDTGPESGASPAASPDAGSVESAAARESAPWTRRRRPKRWRRAKRPPGPPPRRSKGHRQSPRPLPQQERCPGAAGVDRGSMTSPPPEWATVAPGTAQQAAGTSGSAQAAPATGSPQGTAPGDSAERPAQTAGTERPGASAPADEAPAGPLTLARLNEAWPRILDGLENHSSAERRAGRPVARRGGAPWRRRERHGFPLAAAHVGVQGGPGRRPAQRDRRGARRACEVPRAGRAPDTSTV